MAKAKPLTSLDPQAPACQMARRAVYTRLDEMYSWTTDVDVPYQVRGLHNLRIAAKRLRYTLEIFEDVLPATCQAFADELAQVQDELGAVHDSDVMIALLRMCMGSEDAGPAYEQALAKAGKQKSKGKLLLQPDMVAAVLDPDVAPNPEQRYGLEQLLLKQSESREEQYRAFRRHWHQLQARDFRRELLDVLQG
ncbi:MAG TPA: CHAD domain-containing protein [Ktedonobacteraceae bacterium]|nr:CHAD domain-containing protein [Ktedonobacteraceae bacterium]